MEPPRTTAKAAEAQPVVMMKYCYKRSDKADPRRPSHSRQTLPSLPCVQGGAAFELGRYYEIDHEKLPPKSPIQLKSIRVAMVSDLTELDVRVRFPSTHSLRNYFSRRTKQQNHPDLDEQFVMGSTHALKILRRPPVPSEVFEEKMRQRGFWMVSPIEDEPVRVPPKMEEGQDCEEHSSCLDMLRRSSIVCWGLRRKVQYIGKHGEEAVKELPLVKLEEEVTPIVEKPRQRVRRFRSKYKGKQLVTFGGTDGGSSKQSKERWSSERYEASELKLLEIMREKGAVLGNPILRPELRAEARKHIGDTGLLDHLLKHMAGKVVYDGKERFRRRHNPDGAMEYWLEAADLIEARERAGIADPYWVPPPGWKPGDGLFICGAAGSTADGSSCAQEVKGLKEEVASLKRDLEELKSDKKKKKKKKKEVEVEEQEENVELKEVVSESPDPSLHESYKRLMKRKAILEEQLSEITISLNGMQVSINVVQEEVKMLGEGKGKAVVVEQTQPEVVVTTTETEKGKAATIVSEAKEGSLEEERKRSRTIRKSGFRICKPQGTFLWPDMMHTTTTSTAVAAVAAAFGSGGGDQDMMLMVPTPPSASSATSQHKLVFPPPVPPVKPLPGRFNVRATSAYSDHHHLIPPPPPCGGLSAIATEEAAAEGDSGVVECCSMITTDLTLQVSSSATWLTLSNTNP